MKLFTNRYSLRIFAVLGMLLAMGVLTYLVFLPNQKVTIVYNESTFIGDEIVVQFPRWATEKAAVSAFHIAPTTRGQMVWLDDTKELHFVPEAGFDPTISYRITVTLKHPLVAAATLAQKTYTVTAPAAKNETDYPPAITEGKYIDVNFETMKLTLVENGKTHKAFPMAGKGNPWRTPTRQGTFTIRSKENLHWSTIYKLWMPYAMNYSGDYFLHGMPYWPNGARLTSIYSGGCVRLFDDVAKAVFEWSEIGTKVVVHSTPQASLVAPTHLEDGDLVRELGDPRVYLVKQVDAKRFKRHILTDKMQEWYPHLKPFFPKVKIVPQGMLADYIESR